MSFLKCFLFICLSLFSLVENRAYASKFTVYAYLPWKGINISKNNTLTNYGIQPIYVIYESNYMTDGKIDYDKIKKTALTTVENPSTPVSFDMEFGNRFKPETVIPTIKIILKYFRVYNPKNIIGLYATMPQNTYGKNIASYTYDKLNAPYNSLIYSVDFISPSLYNYKKTFRLWIKNAKTNMRIANQYPLKKPIIPYISPIIRVSSLTTIQNGNLVIELSEEEMAKRLDALYQMGASGCIIWASSQDRMQDGRFPQFDPENGWVKAVVRFIKHHEGE